MSVNSIHLIPHVISIHLTLLDPLPPISQPAQKRFDEEGIGCLACYLQLPEDEGEASTQTINASMRSSVGRRLSFSFFVLMFPSPIILAASGNGDLEGRLLH